MLHHRPRGPRTLLFAACAACAVLAVSAGCARKATTAPDSALTGEAAGDVVVADSGAGGAEAPAVSAEVVRTPAEPAAGAGVPAWSSAAFRFVTPPGGPPDWRLDFAVAGELFAPLVARYRGRLDAWRVHRRAAPDEAGHQFTLFVYTSAGTATRLFDDMQRNAFIDQLARGGHLRQLVLLEGGPGGRPNIEDTSDPNWSPELARAWPAFIQGVSDTWVRLVVAHTPGPEEGAGIGDAEPGESLEALLGRYGQARDTVRDLWQNEGSHAFLHHVSAVFGYEPLLIRF